MTKAVFSLPHSFSLMFDVDKVFVVWNETQGDKVPAKIISGLLCFCRFFISWFSRSTLLSGLIGIKWLVKLCKHMPSYRSHPCINSECLCVWFQVCLGLFMHAWQCCIHAAVWSHYESETLGQDSSAHSAHLHPCALILCLSPSVCAYVFILHYVCMHVLYVFDHSSLSLCMCISVPVVLSGFTYCGCFTSLGFWTPEEVLVLYCDNNNTKV